MRITTRSRLAILAGRRAVHLTPAGALKSILLSSLQSQRIGLVPAYTWQTGGVARQPKGYVCFQAVASVGFIFVTERFSSEIRRGLSCTCRTLGLPRRHDAPRRGDMRLDAADWRRPRARAWPCPALIVGEACLAPRSFPCRAHQPRRQQ